MNRRDKTRLRFKKGDFLFQQDSNCDHRSVSEWIRCVDEEDGALICNTIKNNTYEDCLGRS